MKKIGIKWIVFLVMLAVLISSAQAALIVNKVTDEFSLESPYPTDNLKACQCSQRTDVLEVKNIGDFKALFKVHIDSPIKGLITLSDDTFELEPGQATKVYVYIEVPCDQPLETFYVANVCTNYGRSKEIVKQVVSKQCQNIKYTSKVLNDKILPGDTVTIQFDIQNVADFNDNFKIIPKAYGDFTVMSEESVSLAPDQTKIIYLYVKYPLSYYGDITYPFTISSEKAGNAVKGVQSFSIERDYDFTMKPEALELHACEDVTTEVPITISNLAKTPNKYSLHLTAPAFAKLSQEELELSAEEKDEVTLTIKPTQKDVGEYNLLLSAATEYGDMLKDKSFKLVVDDCFDLKASLEGWSQITDKGCYGEKTFTLNIRNDGKYEEAYEIMIDSPGWVSIKEEDKFVRIKPSQNINIPVKLSFPNVDAKQTSFIIVKQLREPYQAQEIKVELESYSQRSCHNIELLQDKYRINYETKSIPMLLQSTGIKAGKYKLQLGEMESRFVYLDQDTMEFEPGETKVLHIYPKNYSSYNQGTYLNRLTLTISLVDENLNIDYNKQFWVVLRDKNFLTKAIDYIARFNYSRIGWCGLVTLILAGITALLVIAVVYMRVKKNLKIKRIKASCMKKIKIVNIALIFLLIISILALILIGNPNTDKFYEQSQQVNSTLYHEWKENIPYQLDLNKYFTDPDTDVLSYTSSQPDHVDVKIEGNIATLTPEHNWAGEEKIVFTANDDKGGIADSPIMTLKVLKRQPIGPMAYWNTYCKHINIVLFIILVLLVLLCLDIIEEKGYNYYNPQKNKNNRK
ncbi:hypothetical protein JW756_01110 [Candidatus Woesearchaeota archaeon]|nr:hypothetical protein [Candidatus Woesearchaeota archaeon]